MTVHRYTESNIAALRSTMGKIAKNMSPAQSQSIYRKAFEVPANELATQIRSKTPVRSGKLLRSVSVKTIITGTDSISVYIGYLDTAKRRIRYSQVLSIEYGSARSKAYKAIQTSFDALDEGKLVNGIFEALEDAIKQSVRQASGGNRLRYSRI